MNFHQGRYFPRSTTNIKKFGQLGQRNRPYPTTRPIYHKGARQYSCEINLLSSSTKKILILRLLWIHVVHVTPPRPLQQGLITNISGTNMAQLFPNYIPSQPGMCNRAWITYPQDNSHTNCLDVVCEHMPSQILVLGNSPAEFQHVESYY